MNKEEIYTLLMDLILRNEVLVVHVGRALCGTHKAVRVGDAYDYRNVVEDFVAWGHFPEGTIFINKLLLDTRLVLELYKVESLQLVEIPFTKKEIEGVDIDWELVIKLLQGRRGKKDIEKHQVQRSAKSKDKAELIMDDAEVTQ